VDSTVLATTGSAACGARDRAELSTFADAYLGVSGGRHAVTAEYGQVVMRALMANKRVQAGVFGVVLFVVTFTTRGGLVAALLLGLIAGLGLVRALHLVRPPTALTLRVGLHRSRPRGLVPKGGASNNRILALGVPSRPVRVSRKTRRFG
jgi:hypothetical protein